MTKIDVLSAIWRLAARGLESSRGESLGAATAAEELVGEVGGTTAVAGDPPEVASKS